MAGLSEDLLQGGFLQIFEPLAEACVDLVADSAEGLQAFLVSTRCLRRIREAPVDANRPAGEHRTPFVGVIAHGDDVVPRLVAERIKGLRRVSGHVDPGLPHRLDGERMDSRRLGTGACRLKTLSGESSEKRLGHLAPGRVMGAEEKHPCSVQILPTGSLARVRIHIEQTGDTNEVLSGQACERG